MVLRSLGHAAVDGQVGEKRFHFRLAHVLGMNPVPSADVVKSQELVHSAAVRMDRSRGQSPHLTGGFILIEELHANQCVAQELFGQFAQSDFTHPDGPVGIDMLRPVGILNAFRSQKQRWAASVNSGLNLEGYDASKTKRYFAVDLNHYICSCWVWWIIFGAKGFCGGSHECPAKT